MESELSVLLREIADQEVPFGKYKGETMAEVYAMDPGYIRFIASKDGMNSHFFKIFLVNVGDQGE